jgi:hypothetical protein
MLRSAERRFRSPLFVREWAHLRDEFESFPEFVSLVTSMHRGRPAFETWRLDNSRLQDSPNRYRSSNGLDSARSPTCLVQISELMKKKLLA